MAEEGMVLVLVDVDVDAEGGMVELVEMVGRDGR